jgi:hypothetical protein
LDVIKADNNKDGKKIDLQKNKQRAFYMGFHLCIIRHFVGGNALITSAGVLLSVIDKSIGHYTPLIINLVQLVAAIAAFVYIS